jgi:outer membrane protein assembly factor BamA
VGGTFINVARPYGVEDLGQVGAAADFQVDTRDQPRAARRGIAFGFGGSYYPAALDVTAPFGEGHAEASSYLTAHIPLKPTLALRVAGKKVWGSYPFYEAAYIGGATTVRGFVEHRFAGDAALYGNAELRLSVAKFYLLVPGQLGVFGLGDAGRVYLSGETSDRWHAAAGGGVWLSFLSPANTLSVAAAHSVEGTRLYVKAGLAF